MRPICSSFSLSAALAIVLLTAGCPASSDDVAPPPDELYFPTGLALDPTESDLYVVNANSDLRFDSGVLLVVDVEAVSEVVTAWESGEVAGGRDCTADASFPLTLICNEADLIQSDRGVRIGNFATEVDIQTLDSGGHRLFVAVRGDPSLTYLDVASAGANLDCGPSGVFGECDEAHRLTSIRDDEDLPNIPDEPFGVYVDDENEFVMATHLSIGAVSLTTAPRDGSPPQLTDAVAGIFSAPNNTFPGAVGVAGRMPGSVDDRIYVTSRTDSRIQTLLVARIPGQPPQIVNGGFFFLNTVLPSTDSRDIQFSSDGNRAFIINRVPPTLQIVDTSITSTGVPTNEVESAIELCRQASNLVVTGEPGDERIYVACFRDGEIWVVDPTGRQVESIISVGRGPQFLVASVSRGLLFVSNFRENTIAVIDIRRGSLTENRVVLRIGRPGETEGVE